MNESKKKTRPTVKYLRELSIVVTGIAITVSIGILVNNHNNKKDQKQYLDAIKLELEDNAKQFEYYAKWLQKPVRYTDYITSNDKNFVNKDTLDFYIISNKDGCGIGFTTSLSAMFQTNAFEMFKFSGAMRQIRSKELLQSIWGVYAQIETSKLDLDRYFRIKEEEAMKYVQLLTEGKKIDVPMYAFHAS